MEQHIKTMTNKPLHQVLSGAIASRQAAMRGTRGRSDWPNIRVAIAFAEQFQVNYPNASDQRVVEWCRKNATFVARIVPANQPAVLAALLGQSEKP
jgi:hypothetical protein